ncbi:MAG: GNAT family N-acetyltransferase [Lentisphaerae bacterium]|nr:GNAT family N-acetyltransferase [Lentisphaerota bacterium]
MLKIKDIRTTERLRELAGIWNELLQRSVAAHAFLTINWLLPWWEVYGKDGDLLVLLAEEEGTPVGIAPLYRTDTRVAPGVHFRDIAFLGSHSAGSEFLDVFSLPGREADVLRAVLQYLQENEAWDRIVLGDMLESSPSRSTLALLAREFGLGYFTRHRYRCPFVQLPESWDTFIDMPARDYKHIIQKEEKRLRKKHDVEVVMSDKSNVDEHLETLFRLHNERWRLEGKAGSFENPKRRELCRRAAKALSEDNMLRLSNLVIDGTIEASRYGLAFADNYYGLHSGCSAEGWKMKAGNVLQNCVYRDLIGNTRALHFLRGTEKYKYQWGGQDNRTLRISLTRTPMAWLVSQTGRCKHLAKQAAKSVLRRAPRRA